MPRKSQCEQKQVNTSGYHTRCKQIDTQNYWKESETNKQRQRIKAFVISHTGNFGVSHTDNSNGSHKTKSEEKTSQIKNKIQK